MFTIREKKIYSDKGEFLKEIDCPMSIKNHQLTKSSQNKLFCEQCEKTIVDTEYLSELDLEKMIKNDRKICLKISKFNPLFNLE
jgi:hypothetical protein